MKLILTCEHGGNSIPAKYESYFKNHKPLQSHRGYDLGALNLFQFLKPLFDSSFYSTASRLLIELNRSLHHKQLFSEITGDFDKREKDYIIKHYYAPYRNKIESKIKNYISSQNTVLHFSIHSFTPSLNGIERNCDIGLLFDSTNKTERSYCKNLKSALLKENPNLKVRFNYPYLGKADGFTTYLRKRFPSNYMGIEIEVNQKFVTNGIINLELKQTVYKAIAKIKN